MATLLRYTVLPNTVILFFQTESGVADSVELTGRDVTAMLNLLNVEKGREVFTPLVTTGQPTSPNFLAAAALQGNTP